MMMTPCQPELLVEYADEELSPAQAQVVEEHLAACADCHRTLAALRKSINLARTGWDEHAATLADFRPGRPALSRRLRRTAAGAVAAALILVLLGSLTWIVHSHNSTHPLRFVDRENVHDPNIVDTRAQIEREGWAARLLASANMLSDVAGGEDIARQRLEQIITDFPDTIAARTARNRLHSERRNG